MVKPVAQPAGNGSGAQALQEPQGQWQPDAREFHPKRLALALILGVVAYWAAGGLSIEGDPYAARMAAAITAFVATCWLTNALHLGAASLLPLPLSAMLGVLPISQSATTYTQPVIWMFFGGFVLALGVERWQLHTRIALAIIARFGVQPRTLVLGFMCASACMSMWLLNTSITLMLLPIALALIGNMEQSGAVDKAGSKNFSIALLLGIAYASSIGGTATPIGTAPNALFFSNYGALPGVRPIAFADWIVIAAPFALVAVPLVWLLLTRVLAPISGNNPAAKKILDEQRQQLSAMSTAEKRMLTIFALAAFLWTTRRDLAFGSVTLPGWWSLLPVNKAEDVGDGSVAVLMAILTFIIPSGVKRGEALMNWNTAKQMPWDILLLMGGGICIAECFKVSGLAKAVGVSLQPYLGTWHPFLVVGAICLLMTFLTEVTSNTATTSIMLPVLAAAATSTGLNPILLMLPATLSASCAFMLPISTPPNAIVFSSQRIPMWQMAKAGFWVNILGVVLLTLMVWFWSLPMLQMAPN